MGIAFTVNGRPVEVEPGQSVLDGINRLGIYIPQLCKDPDRPPLGTCRTCLVQIEGARGFPPSCATPAREGMAVRTNTPQVERIRQTVLSLIYDMLPTEDVAHLGELSRAVEHYGLKRGRFPLPPKSDVHAIDESNAFWTFNREKCILCQRCTQGCQDVQRIYAITLLHRNHRLKVGVAGDGLVRDSNCTTCGQCMAACPVEAISQKRPLSPLAWRPTSPSLGESEWPPVARRVPTICPYCGVGCGILLELGPNDEILASQDMPANPSSRGMLCVKGRFGVGYVQHPDRLATPLIRRERGGGLEPASWEEALELVADKLVQYRAGFAAVASAKATTEDSYVLQKFVRAVMGSNNIDHCARLCHSPSVAVGLEVLGSGGTSNSYEDYERTGCLLVVGSDTDANHPVIAARMRRGVEEGGAKLIVVNPKWIRLCGLADLWLQLRPGTDVALFNGLARIVLEEDLWDREFVAHRTAGFEEWRRSLGPYTPYHVSRVTGVPLEEMRRAARWYARPPQGASCLAWGMGITQHVHGTRNAYSLLNLALLTGQIGKPGSGVSPLRGQNNVQGCSDAGCLPNTLPGYGGYGDKVKAPFEKAWGSRLPSDPGLKLTEMFEEARAGNLKCLYLVGENPILTEPHSDHIREALSRLEFFVTQTIFPNESTEYADVVLPAVSFAEKEGTFTNSERRVQLIRKAIEPIGQARPDWEITGDLARRVQKRLGQTFGGFDFRSVEACFDEMARLIPAYRGVSYGRLGMTGLQVPCPVPDHPGTPRQFGEGFPRGRAPFTPVEYLPCDELPDQDYPFAMNTGRILYHWHGGDLTRHVEGLMALAPRLQVSINPDDAAALGLAEGEAVRVTSRRGELVGVAHLTRAMRRGEIFVPFVRLDGGAANELTKPAYDPVVKIPEYKTTAVRLSKVTL